MSRAEFSNPTRRAANARSGGICECSRISWMTPCGQPLGPGNRYFEHIVTDFTSSDNSLENCAVLTKTCWRIKTDSYDRPHIDKTKRMADRDIGIKRGHSRPMPGSRGTNWKRKLSGETVRRT